MFELRSISIDRAQQRHRVLRVRVDDAVAGRAQGIRELVLDQLDDCRLDTGVVFKEDRIARTAWYDRAEGPVRALEAHDVRRHRVGYVACGGLSAGVPVVNEVVGEKTRQFGGRLRICRS